MFIIIPGSTGRALWRGYFSYDDLPKVLNPKSISLFIEFFLELGSLVLLTEKLSSKSKFFLNSLSISFF
jgi:hypothetical protein